MTRTTAKILSGIREGDINVDDIDIKLFEDCLDSAGVEPLDLIIRTSGETRLSDFLMWQGMSSCVYFCPALWPDFSIFYFFLSIMYYQQNYESVQRRSEFLKKQQTSSYLDMENCIDNCNERSQERVDNFLKKKTERENVILSNWKLEDK
eukprot:TRINITY_DN696_c0_g1_i12.p1 TRINITY_DN696_c0_g1~~TRINITY_DN696_c0_g1_i12.p1  ORF type:complete len:150 (+),score=26.38 TRINITY_DN696_c0_g1_i12:626-1075(+)